MRRRPLPLAPARLVLVLTAALFGSALVGGALAGCGFAGLGGSSGGADASDTVTVREGASARVEAADATLRFEETLAESRCPTGAACVWAGEAVIRVTLAPDGGAPVPVELRLPGDGSAAPRDTLGLRLELLTLTPHPTQEAPRTDAPAEATIRLTRTR